MTTATTKAPRAKTTLPPKRWQVLFDAHLPGYDCLRDAEGCWFDSGVADEAVRFIEHLKHVEGDMAGQLFLLEPWEKAFVGCLFGWKRLDKYGRVVRRYTKVLLYVARKNGKTPICSAICNLLLFTDGEIGAQIYSAASDAEQAALLFRHASGMVEQSPALAKRARIFTGTGQRAIVYEAERSSYKVVSAEAKGKHGFNPHAALIDELHMAPRDLVAAFRTALVSKTRKQPMIVYITTADTERESICNEVHDYAKKVRDGAINDAAFLPVIYEVTREEADAMIDTPEGPKPGWTVPSVWRKANPNFGVSVSEDALLDICREAQNSPALENEFKRFNLNIKTEQVTRAIQMEQWLACAKGVTNPKAWRDEAMKRLAGRTCFAALDLGATQDLTAAVLLFPGDDRVVEVLPYFWMPQAAVGKKPHEYRTLYEAWIRNGYITPTEGETCDYRQVREDIGRLHEQFPFAANLDSGEPEIALDTLFQGMQVSTDLQGDGFDVIKFGQGYAYMTAPIRQLIELIAEGLLHHGNNPVLKWQAGNLCVKVNTGGGMTCVKPNNNKSPLKIDGVVAAVMALGRLMEQDPNEGVSVYERRGLLTAGGDVTPEDESGEE